MSRSHRVIYVAANAGQAHLLRNLLADHGIEAYVSNDTLGGVHFAGGDWVVRAAGGPGLYDTAPCVVVREDDAAEAREIALEAESTLLAGQSSAELDRLDRETDEAAWPACPHCGRRRLATCPVCQTSGTDFDEAFLPEGVPDSAGKLVVICPTCDDPFAAEFPPRCEWCGHRFGDAVEPAVTLAAPDFETYGYNARVAAVLIGMCAVLAGIAGWFYWVLGGSR